MQLDNVAADYRMTFKNIFIFRHYGHDKLTTSENISDAQYAKIPNLYFVIVSTSFFAHSFYILIDQI